MLFSSSLRGNTIHVPLVQITWNILLCDIKVRTCFRPYIFSSSLEVYSNSLCNHQNAFAPAGVCRYINSTSFERLSADVLNKTFSKFCDLSLEPFDQTVAMIEYYPYGAPSRVPADATAFPSRGEVSPFTLEYSHEPR